jgi:hypothetical protein
VSSKEEFKLTIDQCQRLAETSAITRNAFPRKWGEKAVPDHEQLIGREDISELHKTLRSYSPWMQEIGVDYRTIFGEKSDWYPSDAAGKRLTDVAQDDPRIETWKFVDQRKAYTVRLGREALSGVVWCCIVRLHPYAPIPLTTRDPVEAWWAIAAAVGKETAVRKYIGLAGAKRIEWEDDPSSVTDGK